MAPAPDLPVDTDFHALLLSRFHAVASNALTDGVTAEELHNALQAAVSAHTERSTTPERRLRAVSGAR